MSSFTHAFMDPVHSLHVVICGWSRIEDPNTPTPTSSFTVQPRLDQERGRRKERSERAQRSKSGHSEEAPCYPCLPFITHTHSRFFCKEAGPYHQQQEVLWRSPHEGWVIQVEGWRGLRGGRGFSTVIWTAFVMQRKKNLWEPEMFIQIFFSVSIRTALHIWCNIYLNFRSAGSKMYIFVWTFVCVTVKLQTTWGHIW